MQRVPPPSYIEPMQAKETLELPTGREWLYEVKWDGYRMLLWKDGDRVRLVSRNNKDLTADFPGIAAAAAQIKARSALIDGELVALGPDGRPSFQALQNRSSNAASTVYYAFDLLQLNGKPLTEEILEKRKSRLGTILADTEIRISLNLPGAPDAIVSRVSELGLEGIIAKKRESLYEPGERTGKWLKLKLSPEQEFVIGGFKPGSRGIDSLVVGFHDNKQLLCAGSVRQGLNPFNRIQLSELLTPCVTAKCPFHNLPTSKTGHWGEGITAEKMADFKWVKLEYVAQISFVEWTARFQLRHATYKGLREDKSPKDVRKET